MDQFNKAQSPANLPLRPQKDRIVSHLETPEFKYTPAPLGGLHISLQDLAAGSQNIFLSSATVNL